MDLPSISKESVDLVSSKFDTIIADVSERMNYLIQQTCQSAERHHEQCVAVADESTWEMDKLRSIIERCDEIELEFAKIKRIGEIVKEFKDRVAYLEKQA
ncbi:hypothetical protein V1525DRAFT_389550 [Lipomyces kononenkoae]|uniref:Uncharacterized protein n=1 Tax=Lipomyces kononenkoae TaxID=34357 RepID=A0ACC3SXK3_LIPKO